MPEPGELRAESRPVLRLPDLPSRILRVLVPGLYLPLDLRGVLQGLLLVQGPAAPASAPRVCPVVRQANLPRGKRGRTVLRVRTLSGADPTAVRLLVPAGAVQHPGALWGM
ncbi:hypothetical protein ACHAWF_014701 [Thalassiosira exigua]